jgi:signal transduction histidine kinase
MTMREIDLLNNIKPFWLDRAIQSLAPASALQDNFKPELNRFFAAFTRAVGNNDPASLDSILADWSASQTQTELQSSTSSLVEMLNTLMTLSCDVCRAVLPSEDALSLIPTLLAVFSHSFTFAAELVAQAKVNFVSTQLSTTNQALEKLDRSKSDFIAVSAHELKTPLTLIDGYASMLKENLDPTNTSSYQAILLNGILNGTKRLHDIINDMIDASLIDNEILNINFQPVWMSQIITILASECEPAIRERNQTLKVIPFEGKNQMTFGDPERLMQVLRNILMNAIKFTPDGGAITMSGRILPGFYEVTIADNGIGIDPEYLSLIFEKFIRLGTTALHSSGKTKYKGGGPGLGLHIAKGIIESHGGTIWAESPGFDEITCPGSTFHILIPIRTEPPDVNSSKLFSSLMSDSESKGRK